ncbi:hypothetical protein STXM2123_917 [Streptomyces sp. F-3]|nr:hypothetical protein STXM2123_917 [Streptomyces sp. F-3]
MRRHGLFDTPAPPGRRREGCCAVPTLQPIQLALASVGPTASTGSCCDA